MLLGLIRVAFFLNVAAFIVEIDAIDGLMCHIVGAALAISAVFLFNWGCRVAAGQAAKQAIEQAEQRGAQAALRGFRDRLLQASASHSQSTHSNETDR